MLAVKSLAVLAVAFTACHVRAYPGNYYSAESDGAVPSSTGAAAPTTTFGKWIAPSADAARSPCPAMNTLANHGEIARSGRGISTDELVAAMKRVYNLSPLVGRPFAAGGSRFSGVIDLSALQEHGFIGMLNRWQ